MDCRREYEAGWRAKKKAHRKKTRRDWHLKKKYGMSEAGYQKLLKSQENACGICMTTLKRLSVDHDHETGKVRGLLCSNCNTAIGLLKENPGSFERAVKYLRRACHAHKQKEV